MKTSRKPEHLSRGEAKKRILLPLTALLLLSPLLSACASFPLDFGGDDSKDFEVRFFWNQGPQIGEEDPENPGFDKDGNLIPDPEVLAVYAFPDVHAGYAWLSGDDPKLTPTINVEIMEFKVPFFRWFVVAPGAGSNEAHLYVGKRLTSIYEITFGVLLGRRFDEDDWVWGIQGTLLKF